MALTTRHRWCIERIKHCFQDQGVDDSSIHGFIRKSQVLNKFNALFAGDGKNVIFVHYQPQNISLEVRHWLLGWCLCGLPSLSILCSRPYCSFYFFISQTGKAEEGI